MLNSRNGGSSPTRCGNRCPSAPKGRGGPRRRWSFTPTDAMTSPTTDAHVHIWNPARFLMPWLEGDALLEQAFEVEAFAA